MLVRNLVNSIAVGFALICGIAIYVDRLPWSILWYIAALWLGITAYGVLNMSMEFFLKSKRHHPNFKYKAVALTFDDGPNENTLEILALLRRFNAKATFFCIGKQVAQYPDIVAELHTEGHSIGNHTYSHSQWIDLYGTSKVIQEIRKADEILQSCIGKTPKLFRPPYGITNPNIAKAIQHTKHEVIGWNQRSFDTAITSKNLIVKKITKNLKAGDVILLHDTKEITIAVLEQLLLFLQQHHFKTITIDELFDIQAYA